MIGFYEYTKHDENEMMISFLYKKYKIEKRLWWINRMEQLINDLFSNTTEVKQNIDTLLLIMPLSTM